jgi:hypothetical protein
MALQHKAAAAPEHTAEPERKQPSLPAAFRHSILRPKSLQAQQTRVLHSYALLSLMENGIKKFACNIISTEFGSVMGFMFLFREA